MIVFTICTIVICFGYMLMLNKAIKNINNKHRRRPSVVARLILMEIDKLRSEENG